MKKNRPEKRANLGAFDGVNIGDLLIKDALSYLLGSPDAFDLMGRRVVDVNYTESQHSIKKYKNKSGLIREVVKNVVSLRNHLTVCARYETIIVGGGNILYDLGCKNLQRVLSVAKASAINRKKLKIVAVGVGPFEADRRNELLKISEICDYISVRDYVSRDILRDLGISSDILIDPVWYSGEFISDPGDISKSKFGVNIMNINVGDDGIKDLCKSIKHISESTSLTPIIIISAFNGDPIVAKKFASAYSNLYGQDISSIFLPQLSSSEQNLTQFHQCAFILTHRMHVGIFASSRGIPTLIYPWQHKVEGVFHSVYGDMCGMMMIDKYFDADSVVEKLNVQVANSAEIKSSLSRALADNREKYNAV